MDTYRNLLFTTGSSITDSLDSFTAKWTEMTEHLAGMDWKGLFVAGGIVAACLLPKTKELGFSKFSRFLFNFSFSIF